MKGLEGLEVDNLKPQVIFCLHSGSQRDRIWGAPLAPFLHGVVFLHGPGSAAACLLSNLTRTKPYKNDFRLLPKELEKVATLHLIALGAVRTLFSQEHADYLGVKVEGPFKVGHYRF